MNFSFPEFATRKLHKFENKIKLLSTHNISNKWNLLISPAFDSWKLQMRASNKENEKEDDVIIVPTKVETICIEDSEDECSIQSPPNNEENVIIILDESSDEAPETSSCSNDERIRKKMDWFYTSSRKKCPFCFKIFKRESDANNHMKIHYPQCYICPKCRKSFPFKPQLGEHFRKKHIH